MTYFDDTYVAIPANLVPVLKRGAGIVSGVVMLQQCCFGNWLHPSHNHNHIKSHQCNHIISQEYYDLQHYKQQNLDITLNVLNKDGPFLVKGLCKSSFTHLTTVNVNSYTEREIRDVSFMFLWPCIVSKAWRKNTNKMQQYRWFIVNSRCW